MDYLATTIRVLRERRRSPEVSKRRGRARFEPSVRGRPIAPVARSTSVIGTGDGYSYNDRGRGLPPKICVGRKVGATSVNYDARSSYQVTLYDRIVTLSPQRSPRIIDIYINDAFYQRVRW
jgi:hypothetical protein